MPQAPRDAVLSSLTMIVSDDEEDTELRLQAGQLVLDATHPAPTQQEQDAAISSFAQQVADVVIERITTEDQP